MALTSPSEVRLGLEQFPMYIHFVQEQHLFPQEMTWEFSFGGKKKISLEINPVGEFRSGQKAHESLTELNLLNLTDEVC